MRGGTEIYQREILTNLVVLSDIFGIGDGNVLRGV